MSEPTKHLDPVTPVPVYLAIYAILLIGTLISVASSYLKLGPLNVAIVLFIAVAQAVLTLLYMMEVRHSSRVMKMTIVSGIFTLAVLFVMSMSDYVSRAWGAW